MVYRVRPMQEARVEFEDRSYRLGERWTTFFIL